MAILVDPGAPAMERYAAEELRRYLKSLFGLESRATTDALPEDGVVFLVGSPETNPAVREALAGGDQPEPESFSGVPTEWKGHKAFVLSGGSPRATLWAVYELVERWGVHYLLHGDITPARTSFQFPTESFEMKPAMSVRQWRIVNEFACGPLAWGIDDYHQMIDQLAKLKFNRLLVYIWPHGPFLEYSFKGIERTSSALFFGDHFPIWPGMAGRSLFGNEKEFSNPDIPASLSPKERLEAGVRHVQEVIRYGEQRGLDVVISATLTEFPPEFAPLLPGSKRVHQVGELTITPGPRTGVDDANLNGLAKTVLRATVDTYPEAKWVAISMPEHRQWVSRYRDAWRYFDERYRVSEVTSLEAMIEQSAHRAGYHGARERAEAEVKGDLVNLYFYDRLIRDPATLAGTGNPNVRFIFDGVAEELFPILDRVFPPESELLNFIDYTPTRVLKRMDAIEKVPARKIPSVLIYSLHDDNVGLLPQLATHSLHQLSLALLKNGWAGFSARYWLIGEHDPAVAYLSKIAWNKDATPQDVYRDQLKAECGESCVKDMIESLEALETATVKQEQYGLGFAFPVPGMVMKHWRTEPIAPEVLAVRDDYRRSLHALERVLAAGGSDPSQNLGYLQGRLKFGIRYLDAAESVAAGGAAEAAGDEAKASQFAGEAAAKMRESIEAYAGVARDPSDRGAIAILNEFAYKPLIEKAAALSNEAPEQD